VYEPDGTTQWDRPIIQQQQVPEIEQGLIHYEEENIVVDFSTEHAERLVNQAQVKSQHQKEAPPPFQSTTQNKSKATSIQQDDELPNSWIELRTNDNLIYYVYEPDGIVQWDRPIVKQAREIEPPVEEESMRTMQSYESITDEQKQ
jgi:hypothetical protein